MKSYGDYISGKSYSRYIEAKKLNEQGSYADALEIYNELYAEKPENDLINYCIGYSLLSMHEDIRNNPEIERKIREHIKKAKIFGLYLSGQLEEKLGNIELAKKQYKKAIKFGNQHDAFYSLIMLEEKLGNREEARKYYDMFLEVVKSTRKENRKKQSIFLLGKCAMELDDCLVAEEIFSYLTDRYQYEPESIIYLIRTYVKKRNYEEAFKKTCSFENNSFKNSSLYLFILNKLDYLSRYRTNNNYSKKQLLEYDAERAIKHLAKKNKEQFLDYVDLALMFHICNRNIKNLNPVKRLGDKDLYHIDFTSNIAEVDGRKTNRVKVSTIADTKDILTIRPIITEDKVDDYNYTPIDDTEKTKQLSRIEKFNRKYNLQ